EVLILAASASLVLCTMPFRLPNSRRRASNTLQRQRPHRPDGLRMIWSVQDGANTGRTTGRSQVKENTCLVWQGGQWPTSSCGRPSDWSRTMARTLGIQVSTTAAVDASLEGAKKFRTNAKATGWRDVAASQRWRTARELGRMVILQSRTRGVGPGR